jgi:DNA repair ATPase RecN
MKHRRAKRQRMKLEKELISRTLPVSIAKEDGNADTALLQHWIDELDSFETRIQSFCESIAETNAEYGSPTSSLSRCFDALTTSAWMDAEDDMSTVYKSLLDLVDELKDLEGRIEAASSANMALNSLSSTTSVATALEQTRDYLMDATKGSDDGSTAQQAAEHSHDLLNQIEDALAQCAKFMEDDEKGLLAILERQRRACGFSVDEVFELLSEWNLISRKHGISPYLLPTCHKSLRQELDGNVEAKELLPKAIAAEQEAFEELVEASKVLSEARKEVASRLSSAISARLPLLGMESSTFEARVEQVNDVGVSTTALGVDAVDFILVHNGKGGSASGKASGKGGKVDAVASSGEKARILLAIECELPGSVRALCGTMKTGLNNDPSTETDEEVILSAAPPIAVVYDEIDAHVGGRAAVFLAQMLSDQSQSCQVLSITHSPSVAAVADTHVVIHKQSVTGENSLASTETTARIISGLDRRKELARMASGDLAMEEAEIFAEALLRDGASSASASSSSSTRR